MIIILMLFYLLFANILVLGDIPLRQLVYRVHPLPESMMPLVWDFGQLNEETEQAYARQIIMRYVRILLISQQLFHGAFISDLDNFHLLTDILV